MKRHVEQPADPLLRICTVCRETKPMIEGFYRTGEGTPNFKTYGCLMPCKACQVKRTSLYARTSPKAKAARSEYLKRKDVKERSRSRAAAWYATDEGKTWIREYGAKRYAEKREEIRAKAREKYRTDPAKRAAIKADTRRRRATPEGRAAHNTSNSKAKKTEHGRLKSAMSSHRRRARIAEVAHDLTTVEWNALKIAFCNRCVYCDREAKLTIDHVKAISRGGSHTISNVVPACNSCNVKKNATELRTALKRLGCSAKDFKSRRNAAFERL